MTNVLTKNVLLINFPMKKCIISLCVVYISIFTGLTLAQQTLNLVTLDKFAPFTWQEGNSAKGIDVDIVKELCRRSNIKCNISFRPWKRVIFEIKTGKSDGGFSAFITSTRKKFGHILDMPIHYSTYKVFVKKNSDLKFEKIEDLYGKTIGRNLGFLSGEVFDQAAVAGKINVVEAVDIQANINRLMANRVVGIVTNYHETILELKKLKLLDQVVDLPRPVRKPRGAYLIISRAAKIDNKPGLIEKLNVNLNAMYSDGTIEKINKLYLQ
ncbi:substrate-binding periplasmic protein [Spartinivicinus poritis]|uniref:ABC transporter substrate-binding protein n=1 Tax=Spartinivicinus poritis TaxID=2994640 RepID=A0ABT5UFQ3_9GAMM|nr:ABC transporter substrate-binding protein [Spartinivicinus sp. A2-2]MDE1464337.1 ABC transporter substrate-binding protein [Spartinivicinus sp. A2-2]